MNDLDIPNCLKYVMVLYGIYPMDLTFCQKIWRGCVLLFMNVFSILGAVFAWYTKTDALVHIFYGSLSLVANNLWAFHRQGVVRCLTLLSKASKGGEEAMASQQRRLKVEYGFFICVFMMMPTIGHAISVYSLIQKISQSAYLFFKMERIFWAIYFKMFYIDVDVLLVLFCSYVFNLISSQVLGLKTAIRRNVFSSGTVDGVLWECDKLLAVVEGLDASLSSLVLVLMTKIVGTLCFMTQFYLGEANHGLLEIVCYSLFLGPVLLLLLLVAFSSSAICDAFEGVLGELSGGMMRVCGHSPAVAQGGSKLLCAQHRVAKAAVTVGRCFTLSRGTVVSVLGFATSYALVVFQVTPNFGQVLNQTSQALGLQ